MNKYLVQGFIVLIVILIGVSVVSDVSNKAQAKEEIIEFEENVSKENEVNNGNMENVHIIEEDSSNLISDINAKIASIIVDGLNKILNLGLKLLDGFAG